jgi:pyruvate dehydrogenase E1 component
VQTFDFLEQIPDADPTETARLIGEIERSIAAHGPERAKLLLMRLLARARDLGVDLPTLATTPYINTIKTSDEPTFPGDEAMETRIRHIIRWNAAAMVLRANKTHAGIGGHLATYASAASLYEVGFNHFFRGKQGSAGDQIFYQGHAAPGIYSRAYLEGRISAPQLDRYRQETAGHGGLPSYRMHASCQTSGSFQPSPWASAVSVRSIRRATTATSTTAASPTRRGAASGPSSVTVRWMSQSRQVR